MTNNGGQDRQHNGQDNKGRGGGRQTMVDKTDNTMVKRIKGGEGETNNGGQDNTMVKRIMGGDKQWWTRQTTQWSRE